MTLEYHERITGFGTAKADCRVFRASSEYLSIHKIHEVCLIRHMIVEHPLDIAIVKVPCADLTIRASGDENAFISIRPLIECKMPDRASMSSENTVQRTVWRESSRNTIIAYYWRGYTSVLGSPPGRFIRLTCAQQCPFRIPLHVCDWFQRFDTSVAAFVGHLGECLQFATIAIGGLLEIENSTMSIERACR